MKNKKHLYFLCFAILILMATLGFGSLSASAATSGTTGDCTWVLDDTVLTISGEGAMEDYSYESPSPWWGSSITEVIIEDGVTSIGRFAFEQCALTSVRIGNCVTSIADCAFLCCYNLTSITIPDSVEYIGSSAFSSCTNLTNVTIGNGGLYICEYAFSGCTDLTNITLPDNITGIGHEAFEDTAYANDENHWENGVLYIDKHLIKAETTLSGTYSIKTGIKTIASMAFRNCTNLTNVIIPDSVSIIRAHAFENCTNITNITLSNCIEFIDYGTFSNCSSITNITIPDSVEYIGYYAFSNCSSLTSITIGNGDITISPLYCPSLTSAIFTDGRTSMSGLLSGLTQSLSEVTFTKSITSISDRVFSSSKLTTVNFGGTRAEWEAMSYSGNEQFSNATIICTCLNNEHIYDNACDLSCNACDYTRTITHNYQTTWSTDENGHWHQCSVCKAKKDEETHTHDNVCDTSCNVCGHTRTITHSYQTVWSTNESEHWHACSICGAKKDESTHAYDSGSITVHPTCKAEGVKTFTCTVCGTSKTEAITKTADHTYDSGKITKQPTVDEEGVKTFTCNLCGTTSTEIIAKLTPSEEGSTPVQTTPNISESESISVIVTTRPEDSEPDESSSISVPDSTSNDSIVAITTNSNENTSPKNKNLSLIITAILCILAVGGIAAFLLHKKR